VLFLVSCGDDPRILGETDAVVLDPWLLSETDAVVLEGRFTDSPVEGLTYISGKQSGETNQDGRFYYEHGENVTFKLGNIVVGSIVLDHVGETPDKTKIEYIDPRDLAGVTDFKDPVVTNMVRFLQTLDDNEDPEDGIKIPSAVKSNSASSSSINFSLDSQNFENQAETIIDGLFKGVESDRNLVSEKKARDHFIKALLTRIIDNAISEHGVPGIVMALELPGEDELTILARGYADIENQTNMSTGVRFRVGSITKTFTAITVLSLAEEGYFKLDDPLQDVLPEYVEDAQQEKYYVKYELHKKYDLSKIAIRHLLNHFSGLPRFFPSEEIQTAWFGYQPDTVFKPSDLVKLLAAVGWHMLTDQNITTLESDFAAMSLTTEEKLNLAYLIEALKEWKGIKETTTNFKRLFEDIKGYSIAISSDIEKKILEDTKVSYPSTLPGGSWRYSNANYLLLAMIIEEATGDTWENQLTKYCITALGLTNTYVPGDNELEITGDKIAHGYMDVYTETIESTAPANIKADIYKNYT